MPSNQVCCLRHLNAKMYGVIEPEESKVIEQTEKGVSSVSYLRQVNRKEKILTNGLLRITQSSGFLFLREELQIFRRFTGTSVKCWM